MGAEVDTPREARFSDHRHIWLQHKDDADPSVGRMWCQDKVWPETHSDGEPTQYVRADLVAALEVERDTLLARAEAAEETAHAHECRAEQMVFAVSQAAAQRDAAIAERDQAREALKPFAEAAENLDDDHRDSSDCWESSAAMAVTAGDFRRARAALAREAPQP